MTQRLPRAAIVAAALLLTAFGAPAQEDPGGGAYGDEYVSGDFGRIVHQENGATVRRASPDAETGESSLDGEVNVPVFPGDTLLTGIDQRVEIQLAGGTLVRLDRDTELTFLSMPSPYLTVADNTVLQLARGVARLTSSLGDEEDFRIDTPATTIYLISDGDFRLEVDGSGRTRLVSRRGVAELVRDGESTIVRGGTRIEIGPDGYASGPEPFNTFVADAFDRWVEGRDAELRARERYAPEPDPAVAAELPEEVRPYYRELSSYGSWDYEDDYGYVWVPQIDRTDWRPYYDGYWAYGPRGYFWVSSEPWGWAPYRYGRWAWIPGTGWAWIPGRVFGGAWVAWSWGSVYVGWSPLDYWGRPLCVGHVYHGYYDARAWTFLHHDHFRHRRHYPRYAVPVHTVGDAIRGNAVVTRPPRVKPTQYSASAEWRARAERDAKSDVASRVPRLDDGARRGRGLREVEDGLTTTARAEAARRAKAAPPPRASRATSVRVPRRGGEGDSGVGTRPVLPSQRGPERAAGSERPGGVVRGHSPEPGATGRESAAEDSRRESTVERRRDLYRRMAKPRTTEERSGSRPAPERRAVPERDAGRGSEPAPPPTPPPEARRPERQEPRREAAPPPAPRRSPPPPPPPDKGRAEPKKDSSGSSAPAARPSAGRSGRSSAGRPSRAPSRPQPSRPPPKRDGGDSKKGARKR